MSDGCGIKEGLIKAEDYEAMIDRKTKLVIVSLVSWINGLRAEVEEITKMAHEKGSLCMVDSTHGTGYIDIDVRAWTIDFLATSNYKWLLSTHGSSEFYCAKSIWRSLILLTWDGIPRLRARRVSARRCFRSQDVQEVRAGKSGLYQHQCALSFAPFHVALWATADNQTEPEAFGDG